MQVEVLSWQHESQNPLAASVEHFAGAAEPLAQFSACDICSRSPSRLLIFQIRSAVADGRHHREERREVKALKLFYAPLKKQTKQQQYFASAGENSGQHGEEELICISLEVHGR